MELIDLDTVVVVDRTGHDEDFTPTSHPGMLGYIEPRGPGKALLVIEIPIVWSQEEKDDSAESAG